MFKRLIISGGVIALMAGAGLWITRPISIPPAALPNHTPDLANGEVLFWEGGCASCHAAPGAKGDDKLLLSGGLELPTPFGTFRAPNLSPSKTEGVGGWSQADFVTAMVEGSSPENTHYYPAFPYTSYTNMTLTDLMDLKAFLDTLPVSDNHVAEHDIPFPFSIRAGLGIWKLLYLNTGPFKPHPQWSEEINRGAYLVEGPGHCAECHTPRDFMGGLQLSKWLSGAPSPHGEGIVPNITPSAEGLSDWSAKDISYYLETGFTPDFDSVGGSMTSVQENWAKAPPEDRATLAAYLKSIPPLSAKEQ